MNLVIFNTKCNFRVNFFSHTMTIFVVRNLHDSLRLCFWSRIMQSLTEWHTHETIKDLWTGSRLKLYGACVLRTHLIQFSWSWSSGIISHEWLCFFILVFLPISDVFLFRRCQPFLCIFTVGEALVWRKWFTIVWLHLLDASIFFQNRKNPVLINNQSKWSHF